MNLCMYHNIMTQVFENQYSVMKHNIAILKYVIVFLYPYCTNNQEILSENILGCQLSAMLAIHALSNQICASKKIKQLLSHGVKPVCSVQVPDKPPSSWIRYSNWAFFLLHISPALLLAFFFSTGLVQGHQLDKLRKQECPNGTGNPAKVNLCLSRC